jgi:hypothetical protein
LSLKFPQTPNEIRACGKKIFSGGHPNEISQVRGGINAIKTKCKKGVLVDEKNKPVKIMQNYCEPGVPPRPGDGRTEARQTRRQEIENAKKKNRVITYNCYSPRP